MDVSRHHTSALLQLQSGSGALHWLRDTLGDVAPRDPLTRRLGERRWRLELLAEMCDRQTFVLVTEWLASDAVPSVKSKRDYADDIRLWAGVARELGGHERFFVGAVTPGMVKTWTSMQKSLNRSGRTINRRLSVLSALTRYAEYRMEEKVPDPVSVHSRVKVDPHDETTATPILEVGEYQRVVGCAETPQEALVPVLVYTLAGRVTECCTAPVTALRYMGGREVLDLRRKGGKGSVFPVPAVLSKLIAVATEGRPGGTILADSAGKPMTRHAVADLLTRLGRRAGVLPGRHLTPHVLRASKLTHMYDDGVPLSEIQEFASHALPETTLRYIRRRDRHRLREVHADASVVVYEHLVERFLPGAG